MKKYICQQCGKTFETYYNNRKYCSRQCFGLSSHNKHKSIKTEFKKGNSGFWLGKKRLNMTGKNHPNYVKKISVICPICKKQFNVIPSLIKRGRGKFCSKKCYSKGSVGRKGTHNKGGKSITDDGYILIWQPKHPYAQKKGYILEHRLIMEKYLKRYLTSVEIVHHEDEYRQNNDISNLRLFNSRKEHIDYHKKHGSYDNIDYASIVKNRKRNFNGQFTT